MNNNEMTCQELVELVTDYFEGTLDLVERARFEAHVAECDGCRIYLQQMQQTISVCGMLTEESIAPEAKQELLQLFRNWKSG